MTWTPFVGTFIAKISKGRKIREFILVIFLVPCLLTCIWFSIMGGTAIHLETTSPSTLIQNKGLKLIFGCILSTLAIMFVVTGALPSIQSLSSIFSLPFMLILLLMLISMFIDLKKNDKT
ncbi:BCCT family transporter [Eubacterium callanderi]|uniref:BCCT family transporter n=1 Tax=Eubacterium callanderi TaxID=53442 RepID=UPI003463FE46